LVLPDVRTSLCGYAASVIGDALKIHGKLEDFGKVLANA